VVNDSLIPLLNKHGFGFDNCEFEWDETYEFTQEEMIDIETVLLEYYDIDPVYFMEKYNIKITGVKQQPQLNPAQPSKPAEKKKQ